LGKLSRDKGKRGEREVVDLLKLYGFEARRGQQFKGTKDSPDVIHNMAGVFIEVKLRQSFNLYATIEQARLESEAGGEDPVVFHRKDGKPWLVTMYAGEFLKMMKELYDED
jgi:Holliday junction resolvase